MEKTAELRENEHVTDPTPHSVSTREEPLTWRERGFLTLSYTSFSTLARWYSLFMAVCVIASITQLILQSYVTLERDPKWKVALFIFDTVVSVIFTLDYFARFLLCYDKVSFVCNPLNIIDLLSFLPYYIEVGLIYSRPNSTRGSGVKGFQVLRILRILRVVRMFRLSRNLMMLQILFAAIMEAWQSILLLYLCMAIFALVAGSVIYFIETSFCKFDQTLGLWVYNDNISGFAGFPTAYQDIMNGIWWAYVTVTTVGYGDTFPVTGIGRLAGSFALVVSLVVLALPISLVGGTFSRHYDEMKANNAQGDLSFASFRFQKLLRQEGPEEAARASPLTWESFGEKMHKDVVTKLDLMVVQCEGVHEHLESRYNEVEALYTRTCSLLDELRDVTNA